MTAPSTDTLMPPGRAQIKTCSDCMAGVDPDGDTCLECDGTGKQVAQWNLLDVYPSAWSGPAFHVDGEGVANESVELVHHGFSEHGG